MKLPSRQTVPWLRIIFTAVPLTALLVCYSRWLLTHTHATTAGMILSAVSVLLFAILGIRFIPQWMEAWSGAVQDSVPTVGRRSGRFSRMHPIACLLLGLLFSRVLIYIAAYILFTLKNGYQGGFFNIIHAWNPGSLDSRHYLSIAENGYVIEGDERLKLVFFPMYPLFIKAFSFLTGGYLSAGFLVSNLAFLGAGYLLYELVLLDHDRDTALRTVLYLCILPAGILFCAPLSDSLFLLETVACLYLARKKKYLFASLTGCAAAFTRMPGILLVAPVLFELIGDSAAWNKKASHPHGIIRHIGQYACVLLIPAGTLLYLFLNYRLTGNAFTFLTYQRENWHQGMGWFFSTAEYQLNYAISSFTSGDLEALVGLWGPNLISLLSAPVLLICAQKKMRPSYVAYFIAYYFVTMGATWLLSAPRYLMAAFPLTLSLGILSRDKRVHIPLTLLCIAGMFIYLYAFLMRWSVY